MTNSSPPERPSPRTKPLKKDEKLALVVTFLTLGSIFFWVLNRSTPNFDLARADSWKNLTSDGELKFPSVLQPAEEVGGIALLDPDREGDRTQEEDETAVASADPDAEGTIPEVAADLEDGETGLEILAPIVPLVPAVGLLDSEEGDPTEALADVTEVPEDTEEEEEEAATPTDSEAATPTAPIAPEGAAQAPESPEPTQINPDLPDPEDPVKFTDVPPQHWAYLFIGGLSSRQVITGFQDQDSPLTFQPDASVTRAQLAVQIEKLFDLQDKQPTIDFQDIAEDFWAAGAISESNEANFLNGYPNREFRPAQTLPRLELLIALATGLGLPLPENPDAVLEVYQDTETVPEWAKPKIAAATQAGLVAGYPDRRLLELERDATRAEVVAMMYQALVLRGAAEPIDSDYVVPGNP
ncbi:MAG: S-layer homology domain-containing protein [Cyanobacteriota bacterium]|nr:S-layer homology domain-containing protein [Cyanobacteriota bacterium]